MTGFIQMQPFKISTLVNWITPFVLVAVLGGVMVVNGILNSGQENNALNYIFGVPVLIGALLSDFLIRQVLNRNRLHIWLLELFLVATFCFAFYYVW